MNSPMHHKTASIVRMLFYINRQQKRFSVYYRKPSFFIADKLFLLLHFIYATP